MDGTPVHAHGPGWYYMRRRGKDALSVAKVARGEAEPRSGRKRPRGRPSRRRDERPMRGPHGGAYRSVSRIPSGESARCAEEALLRRAGREATAKPPARARARSRRVRRGGPPARRRFDKVNASSSPGRVGDRRNCYLNQSAIQHLPLTT